LFAAKADSIITVSEFSKNDIVAHYSMDPSNVHVVCNAAQQAYHPISETERSEVRNSLTQGEPYFVFISSIHPRKNLQRLLLAYDQFRLNSGRKVKLVTVGRRFWKNELLDTTLQEMQFGADVIFTGHLEQAQLCSVLGGALALVYVSYFEGFGVPIVEAFQSGVPVITSNVTAMPEVAGDAAVLVDPFSVEEIAKAMERISSDESLRNQCIELGLKRASSFDWDQSAERFWRVIEMTVSQK
jgi:glycosyltransferase involved in cell wall biosynthesis